MVRSFICHCCTTNKPLVGLGNGWFCVGGVQTRALFADPLSGKCGDVTQFFLFLSCVSHVLVMC